MEVSPNQADAPRNNDPETTETDSVVGVSGRKGGATPVALYEDYAQARSFDMTRNTSENTFINRWLPILIALAIVIGILTIASHQLSFPRDNGAEPNASSAPAPGFISPLS